ncbi:MAG: hypothetical protein DMF64_00620, partial [Acidobacteria bacterium]
GKKSTAKKRAGTPRKAAAQAARGKVLSQSIIKSILDRRQWVMYAQPIFDVIATGNVAEMRRAAEVTRKHLAEVQKTLGQLDAAIRAGGR